MEKYYPFMKRMIGRLKLEWLLVRDTDTIKAVEVLYRRGNHKKIWLEMWCRRLLIFLLAFLASVLFLLVCLGSETVEDVIRDKNCLYPAEDMEEVTFGVRAESESGLAQDEITVDLRVPEKEKGNEQAEVAPDAREIFLEEIRKTVEESVSQQISGGRPDKIVLPESVLGVPVAYVNPDKKRDFSAFYLSVLCLILLPFLWRRQRQEQLKKREEQLVLDYPEFVNKLMLLLSAGLTVRGCFERLSEEYAVRLQEGGRKHYVYEEISFSFQEMKNGVPEAKAIEQFGRRCHQLSYLKFASIVNQNIRKGSEGVTELLEVEAMEAFEKRKEKVKIMGETAATRLLLPMVLMLGVVMIIIIVPAFMTM